MANQNDEYIPVEAAADLLQLGVRMVNRYGNPPYNRLQTRKVGRRVLYRKADVLALADALGVAYQPRPQKPKTELVPVGDVLEHIRWMQEQLNAAMLEVGRLQGTLEQQRLLAQDAEAILLRLQAVVAERDELRAHRLLHRS